MPSTTRTAHQLVRALEGRGLDTRGLSPVGVRPPLGRYLAQLWDRRHFIWVDARHRVGSLNSRNRLGSFWLLLRPLLDAGFYFLIFGVILQFNRDIDNFAAYIIIGVLMFRATATSVTTGPSALASSKSMIRAFSFPRASIPISAVLKDALQMIWAVGAMLLMIALIPPHELPNLVWPLIIPLLGLQWVLNLGIVLILARVGFQFPDTVQLMSFASRVLMYSSGVIFPIDRLLTHPTVSAVIQANPVYQMLRMYREILMDGTIPPVESWLILGGWAVALLLIGFLFFWRGEASYGNGE